MIKPKFYGHARGGKFVPDEPDVLRDYMAKFPDGKEMEMTIGTKYKRRSQGEPGEQTNFNGYYWGVVVRIISDVMGELDDQVTHNLLQMKFNKKGVTVGGENIEVPAGTKEMSGADFSEYCSKIRMWAAQPGSITERGVYIPEPHEAEYDDRG